MRKPKVIVHNSISLDGSLLGFEVDMEKHYQIAGGYQPEVHLIGSNTVEAGIKMFNPQIPKEEKSDFVKPERDANLPLWVIPDTRGKLQGLHHVYRRFEFCRDVAVLVSRKTPKSYLDHLKERNYDCLIAGEDHIDCRKALELLADRYGAQTVLTDTGRILNCILINEGLVDEISLLVHPVIVSTNPYALFSGVKGDIKLELASAKEMGDGKVWLTYKVQRA